MTDGWLRDGTLKLPSGTQIDLRNRRSTAWLTVKADTDRQTEMLADRLLRLLNRKRMK